MTGQRTASAAGKTRIALRRSHERPVQALLSPLPEPDCKFKSGPSEAHGPDNGDALRMKLDYERQCYRQAEMIVRDRLLQLQASIGTTKHREPDTR